MSPHRFDEPLRPRKPCKIAGLLKGAFLENRVKRPDSIGVTDGPRSLGEAGITVFMIWVDSRSGKRGWTEMAWGRKKSPPNASMRLRRALYAVQFEPRLGNGGRYRAILTSERPVTVEASATLLLLQV
jgi:hypothetical protein